MTTTFVPGAGGGGTQYPDGTTQATPTGTAALAKNPSNVLKTLAVDASGNLNVNLAAGSISGGNAAASPTGAAVPVSADYTGFNSGGNLVGVSGTNPLPVSLANTGANATALKVDGSAVVQPVSGTVTTTPPANASTNVAQVAGTTTDTNSGLKSAGTLRVVLATDQPQLTNKLLVTPDSVALPANQSVNVSQINAVTPLMGNGLTGTGSQRVTIASDNTAFAVNATLSAETTKVIGTARVLGNGGATLDSTAAAGTAPTNALLTGNVFNTTVPAPTAGQAVARQCDAAGSVYVNAEGRKTTYRMATRGFTPVASASSPIFSIQGSASKTIRITHIKISWSCTTGTALPNDISLQKFSALTGGTTGNTPTGAKNDTNNAAQTAICLQYSAVPTTATAIGGIAAVERMTWVTAGAAIPLTPPIDWVFGNLNEQGLVLRGTSEFYGIVLAAIGSTPVMSIWIEWTEE